VAEAVVSQVVLELELQPEIQAVASQAVVEVNLHPVIPITIAQAVVEIWRSTGAGPTPQSSTFTTRTEPIRWLRRSPIYAKENQRVSYDLFQLDAQVGVGTTNPPGDDPQVFLTFSDDAGKTWSTVRPRSMGQRGQYGRQIQWWRNGQGRMRVFEVYGSDPVPVALVDAFAKVETGTDG
jgi:hypothetical protein